MCIMIFFNAVLSVILLLCTSISADNEPFKEEILRYINATESGEEPIPRVFFSTEELVEARNLKAEKHEVETEDGYILSLHRIYSESQSKRLPVLVVHGILLSSDSWLVAEKKDCLPFALVDAGYEVWLGDIRGNAYSKKHKFLNPSSKEFWKYSWHEFGIYDVPAFIDYILQKTESSQLLYVGHSLGAASFMVMASMKTEYNAKIRLAILMAPVYVIPNETKYPLANLGLTIGENAAVILNGIGMSEFLPRNKYLRDIMKNICITKFFRPLCLFTLQISFHQNLQNIDWERSWYILTAFPAGTSSKLVAHTSQNYKTGTFRQFDYGTKGNMKYYNSTEPPQYDISKITAPVAIIYSMNDPVLNEENMKKLGRRFPNLVSNYRIPQLDYSHIDYIFGKTSHEVLFPKVIDLLDKFDKSNTTMGIIK